MGEVLNGPADSTFLQAISSHVSFLPMAQVDLDWDGFLTKKRIVALELYGCSQQRF